MDHFQFTGQFNLHDLIIRVYITVYYFGSYLSLEWVPTLASCWHWLKWTDVTTQGLFEVTVFEVEFCLEHCWWFSVCPHHLSETMSYIYWCMCPTNSSYLTMIFNFLQKQFVRENSFVYRKYSEPNSIWEVCGSKLDRHICWRDWGFSWNLSVPPWKFLSKTR
jgi:hypothetical protein